MEGLPDIGEMIKQISDNPTARDMLLSLLSAENEEEPTKTGAAPEDQKSENTLPVHSSPRTRSSIKRHHALLSALRPYLGERRCATLSRMEKALDIYDLIEQMRHTKGGNDVYS